MQKNFMTTLVGRITVEYGRADVKVQKNVNRYDSSAGVDVQLQWGVTEIME